MKGTQGVAGVTDFYLVVNCEDSTLHSCWTLSTVTGMSAKETKSKHKETEANSVTLECLKYKKNYFIEIESENPNRNMKINREPRH